MPSAVIAAVARCRGNYRDVHDYVLGFDLYGLDPNDFRGYWWVLSHLNGRERS